MHVRLFGVVRLGSLVLFSVTFRFNKKLYLFSNNFVMESFYKTYTKKDFKDISNLLETCSQLTIESRLALKKVISENFSTSDFNQEQVKNLD